MTQETKDNIKRHAISAAITFGATFLFFFCSLVMNNNFQFTKDAIAAAALGALLSAVRAVAKIVYEACEALLSSPEK